MKIPLPAALFKARARDLESLPKESFLDVIRENLFLRRLALVMGLGWAGLVALLGWSLAGKSQVVILDQPLPVSYADQTQPPAGGELAGVAPDTGAAIAPPNQATRVRARDGSARVVARRLLFGGQAPDDVARATATLSPSQLESHEPDADTRKIPQAAPGGLWVLLDSLKDDHRREVLDRVIAAEGVSLTFKEASPSGLVSFELSNDGRRTVYLPYLEVRQGEYRAYLERRVLEPGSRSRGVIQVPGLDLLQKLELAFGAANLKAVSISLELPRW